MRTRLVAAAALLLVATLGSSDPAPPATRPRAAVEIRSSIPRPLPAPTPYDEPDLSIPGGGRILVASGWVIHPDGTRYQVSPDRPIDTFWDSLRRGGVLVIPNTERGPDLRAYQARGGRWKAMGNWRVDLFFEISPDGRHIAHSVFANRRMTGTIRVINRRGEPLWELSTDFLYPVSWTPDGRVLLSEWSGVGLSAWEMSTGNVTTLLLAGELRAALPDGARSPSLDVETLSWSADGRYFAARASWTTGRKTYRHGIVIGLPSGQIVDVVATGKEGSNIPTWSPTRSELAFIESAEVGWKARLYVYDVEARERTLLLRQSPVAHWVAWSPRGDWLLVDTQGPWVFVSRHGAQVIERPRLGGSPRWASPGHDIPVPKC